MTANRVGGLEVSARGTRGGRYTQMDETERKRLLKEKFAFHDDVYERLTAVGITDLKTRWDIAEQEWYLFTLNCEEYEQERFKRSM